MHLTEFETLPLSLQAGLLCRSGVYLSERTSGGFLVALYALHHFYAEVHYCPHTSEVIQITGFASTALLAPYLCRINIEGALHPAAYR